jgi:excisionase family DNA binding protein
MPEWLTTTQAARALDISESRVRALADRGELTVERTPLGRLFSAESVEKVRKERDAQHA